MNVLHGISSTMMSPFQKDFTQIHERSHSLWQLQPYEVYFLPTDLLPLRLLKIRLESQNNSLIYGLQNGCCVSKQENINLLCISIRAHGRPGALSTSSDILKGILFPKHFVSTVGLKYSVNHVVNRCTVN